MRFFKSFLIVALVLISFSPAHAGKEEPQGAQKAKVVESYGKLPLYFIQNNDQMDENVKYYEKGSGKSVYFAKDGVYIVLSKRKDYTKEANEKIAKAHKTSQIKDREDEIITETLHLKPLNANLKPEITAEEPLSGKINYFMGNDPKKWRTDVPTYGKIRYKEIYPGIDIIFYGNHRQLEYDIVVKPGADLSVASFDYEGAKELKQGKDGELIAVLPSESEIIQKKLKIYEKIGGKKVEIEGRSCAVREEKDRKLFTFKLSNFNPKFVPGIVAVLAYFTHFGRNGDDLGNAIVVDSSSNAYIVCLAMLAALDILSSFSGVMSMFQERRRILENVGQEVTREPKQIVSLSGWFTVVWNDRTRYFLIEDQGLWTELLLDEEMTKQFGGPLVFNCKRVKIVGERLTAPSGAIRVLSISFE